MKLLLMSIVFQLGNTDWRSMDIYHKIKVSNNIIICPYEKRKSKNPLIFVFLLGMLKE